MMLYSVIDIGSNTIRLNIYQYEKEKLTSLLHKKSMAGLAGYVENGALSQKGIEAAVETLGEFRMIADHFDIGQVYAFATASLRNIVNSDEVVRVIKEKTGFSVEIIGGEEEATLDFIGATHGKRIEHGLMIDIGGGSTELAFIEKGEIVQAFSLPIGSLSMFSDYVEKLFPEKHEKKAIRERVERELDKLSGSIPPGTIPIVCGVGGTIRAAKKLDNELNGSSDFRSMAVQDIAGMLKGLKKGKKETLRLILQAVPDRVHTIIPGMVILQTIAKRFQCETIFVSKFGVREGYLYKRVLKEGRGNGEK
ncbi:phosphatase [Bacillus sp. 1P06AnD]|uniref:Ppx/GppA phosphatase family protein n=1 Tax=Bacillus sp. 1P06AnD TaxID=3132208 RepID=UPI0039A0790D